MNEIPWFYAKVVAISEIKSVVTALLKDDASH